MRLRSFLVGASVLLVVALGALPASAANPYNAKGFMDKNNDYSTVWVDNLGAGSIGVRAKYSYTPPGSGASTYESSSYFRVPGPTGKTITTPLPPAMGYTYTVITHFKGCSSSTAACTLGAWDSSAASHTFS